MIDSPLFSVISCKLPQKYLKNDGAMETAVAFPTVVSASSRNPPPTKDKAEGGNFTTCPIIRLRWEAGARAPTERAGRYPIACIRLGDTCR